MRGLRKAVILSVEVVDKKKMSPNILKDGTTFRVWREEFERYSGLRVKGIQGVLKEIGGKRSWSD